MPLIESKSPSTGQQFWPPYPEAQANRTQHDPPPPPPSFPAHGLIQSLDLAQKEIERLKQALQIQRETFRRLCEIEEGDLMALEKTVVQELFEPRNSLTLDDVQQLIERNLEIHASQLIAAISGHVREIVDKKRPPASADPDPLGTAPDPEPEDLEKADPADPEKDEPDQEGDFEVADTPPPAEPMSRDAAIARIPRAPGGPKGKPRK